MDLLVVAGLFLLGLLHGLGPDHLAALVSLTTGDERRRGLLPAVATAVRFGAGHAGVLGAGAVAVLGLGLALPEELVRTAELSGGGLVALLGLGTLAEVAGLLPRPRILRHRHAATATGAALAVSGVRGLLLALPAAGGGSAAVTAAGVAAFGAGVVGSMVGAVLAARLAGRLVARAGLDPGPRLARGLVGAGSVVVGCGWIWASW